MKITRLDNTDKTKNIDNFKEGEFFIDISDGEIMVKLDRDTESYGNKVNAFSITKQQHYRLDKEELLPIKIEEIIYKEDI